MKLLLEKELPRAKYNCGKSGRKIYALSSSDGIDIYSQQDHKLLFSFVDFQGILDLFLSYDERYLIGLNRKSQLLCFDLIKKEHVSTFIGFKVNFGEILSITTSIDKNELIVIYTKENEKKVSRLVRFSLPLFNMISDVELDNYYITIKKSILFRNYYLSGLLSHITYLDTNFISIGKIEFPNDIVSIKGCFSLEYPSRLLVSDFKKLYLLNSKYELYDEISLIDRKEFLNKFKKPDDILNMNYEEELETLIYSELTYSSGLYKDKYLVSIINNITLTNQKIRINDINTSERIFDLRILSEIRTILLLPNNILISGNDGTYLFKEDEEKNELLISNPKSSSLGFIHKGQLINERLSSKTT